MGARLGKGCQGEEGRWIRSHGMFLSHEVLWQKQHSKNVSLALAYRLTWGEGEMDKNPPRRLLVIPVWGCGGF